VRGLRRESHQETETKKTNVHNCFEEGGQGKERVNRDEGRAKSLDPPERNPENAPKKENPWGGGGRATGGVYAGGTVGASIERKVDGGQSDN